MIDLMFPFFDYNPNERSGLSNPGGGMPTKLIAVRDVLSRRYILNIIQRFEEVKNDVLIIEPLTPRLADLDFEEWIEALHACKAKKILYCSEMEICRWAPRTFQRIMEGVDLVTANTKYQANLIKTLSGNEIQPFRLCDPIDEMLFCPSKKRLHVFSAGRVSKDKNSDFLIDVFKKGPKVWGPSVQTAYFGSATLWGHANPIDIQIEREIESCVDYFEGGVSRNNIARLFGESLIYFSKTKHDVYSSTHVEILSSGCLSTGGGHPMFRERPGISGLRTAKDFIKAIQSLLKTSPSEIDKLSCKSRDYVLRHCGFEAFQNQFDKIIQELLS